MYCVTRNVLHNARASCGKNCLAVLSIHDWVLYERFCGSFLLSSFETQRKFCHMNICKRPGSAPENVTCENVASFSVCKTAVFQSQSLFSEENNTTSIRKKSESADVAIFISRHNCMSKTFSITLFLSNKLKTKTVLHFARYLTVIIIIIVIIECIYKAHFRGCHK